MSPRPTRSAKAAAAISISNMFSHDGRLQFPTVGHPTAQRNVTGRVRATAGGTITKCHSVNPAVHNSAVGRKRVAPVPPSVDVVDIRSKKCLRSSAMINKDSVVDTKVRKRTSTSKPRGNPEQANRKPVKSESKGKDKVTRKRVDASVVRQRKSASKPGNTGEQPGSNRMPTRAMVAKSSAKKRAKSMNPTQRQSVLSPHRRVKSVDPTKRLSFGIEAKHTAADPVVRKRTIASKVHKDGGHARRRARLIPANKEKTPKTKHVSADVAKRDKQSSIFNEGVAGQRKGKATRLVATKNAVVATNRDSGLVRKRASASKPRIVNGQRKRKATSNIEAAKNEVTSAKNTGSTNVVPHAPIRASKKRGSNGNQLKKKRWEEPNEKDNGSNGQTSRVHEVMNAGDMPHHQMSGNPFSGNWRFTTSTPINHDARDTTKTKRIV